ncbi:hypothetical protein MHYP_G00315880 [Metynnis hypsauchen]
MEKQCGEDSSKMTRSGAGRPDDGARKLDSEDGLVQLETGAAWQDMIGWWEEVESGQGNATAAAAHRTPKSDAVRRSGALG